MTRHVLVSRVIVLELYTRGGVGGLKFRIGTGVETELFKGQALIPGYDTNF